LFTDASGINIPVVEAAEYLAPDRTIGFQNLSVTRKEIERINKNS
jgi:hypothetical protein